MMRSSVLALLILAFSSSGEAQVGSSLLIEQAGVSLVPTSVGLEIGADRAEQLRALVPSSVGDEANAVVLDQEGAGNRVGISQNGTGNRFLLSQVGDALTASFLQDGVGNDAVLSMLGSDNAVGGAQIGDGNQYTLSLSASGTEHELLQVGDDLQATQIVAPGMLPASIEQRGQGTAVTVVRQ